MAKPKLSKSTTVKELEQVWLHSPHGSEEEKIAVEMADRIIREKLKGANTPEVCWKLHMEALHNTASYHEAWQKWNELDKSKGKREENHEEGFLKGLVRQAGGSFFIR